ncbi:carbonic anhydrase [Bordetella bronchialis]|uniref:Carbonic anhydrase n=1 Tax=Bordetella bronchialis TaxID=463025 RepID=A0A193FI75_9BORD|nr:carbonic anhydrase [Bordetella bronchialis]ANN66891.1 carbonate dehydratase [Bordetella bronchialis]ANN71967.1 carbonate dehydratase [Bordetella bronchialis]
MSDTFNFPKRLTAGYQDFLAGRFPAERNRFRQLAEGQSPEIMVIGCCDSRVAPELIFDAGPGEIFVLRNVANLVPPYEPDSHYHGTSSAIEFAVNGLNVKHIVVMGHASCGGIRSYYDDAEPLAKGDFIGKWMSQIEETARKVDRTGQRQDDLRRLELRVVEHSLKNLMTFPYIRQRVERGELQLHGAYFGVATGLLFIRDPHSGEFVPFGEGPADDLATGRAA